MDTPTALTTALQAGRIGIGVAAVVAPSYVGRQWIGRVGSQPDTQVMTRAFGIRDLALGAATLGAMRSAGTDGVGFRVLTGLGVLVDVVDAASAVAAKQHIPGASQTTAIAGTAALTGVAVLALTTEATE